MLSIFSVSLLVGSLLLTVVDAGRFSEYSQRKGYGPNLRQDTPMLRTASASSNTNFRFLTNDTKRKINLQLPES